MQKTLNIHHLAIFVFIAAIFCLLPVYSAFAQGAGITISPIRFEELVDPGETLNKSIRITNISDSPRTFYVYLRDFKAAANEDGKPELILPGSEQGFFMASWIKFPNNGTYLEPGEEKEVPFTVEVPSEIGPGGYYGGIFLGTEPPEIRGQSGIGIAQQTGTLILLQVSGDIIEEAMIREFSVDKDFYSVPFEVIFLTRIDNKSNVHIKPHGTIEIFNMGGERVEVLRINDSGSNILPASIRRFVSNWEGDKGFGRYKAQLALSYGTSVELGGEGKKTISSVLYFWIIPWRTIILGLIGLVFIAALLVLGLKIYKNRAIKKAMGEAGLGRIRYTRKYKYPSPFLHLGLFIIVLLFLIFILIGGVIFFLFF